MTTVIDATLDKRTGGAPVLRGATLAVRAGHGPRARRRERRGQEHAREDPRRRAARRSRDARRRRQAARHRDAGIARRRARRASASSSSTARRRGTLSVVENAVLGVESARSLLDLDATPRALQKLGEQIGLADRSVGARRFARRSVRRSARRSSPRSITARSSLILDEPTAVLAPVEVEGLLATPACARGGRHDDRDRDAQARRGEGGRRRRHGAARRQDGRDVCERRSRSVRSRARWSAPTCRRRANRSREPRRRSRSCSTTSASATR